MKRTNPRTLRALNGFGLGARIGEAARIGDPQSWLEQQLDATVPTWVTGAADPDEIGLAIKQVRELRRRRNQDALADARRAIRAIVDSEMRAALHERIVTQRPFLERLVAFWSNHLCVSVAAKPLVVGPLAGLYERQAIRPHVLGRFEDMVLASARHPTMLLYLDNAQSIGPRSAGGRMTARRGNERGLNENYARELLELHTVGVDGGYTQDDVVELAKVLTGWSVVGAGRDPMGAADSDVPKFRFYPALHEPGTKNVMGERYSGRGESEGESVIRNLCRHPSTARFVSTKLVRHFVSDEPPVSAIDTVERVFRETNGDLREVSRTLIYLDAAWDADSRKFRTPQDWLVAALRALNVSEAPPRLAQALGPLRHPLWAPAAPKGYGDGRGEWSDPDSLINRAELARTITRPFRQIPAEPEAFLEVVNLEPNSPLLALLADRTIDRSERLALVFGGPAFQWR